MELDLPINPQLDIPLYVQIVDALRTNILSGRIPYGTKLPTVRRFSESRGIARGTVVRAYSVLEQQGYLKKEQGSGTFVCYREDDAVSRKDSAMAAIDTMLDTLDALSFSRTETEIFLDLKLRERYTGREQVHLALAISGSEAVFPVSEQLRALGGVEVSSYMPEDVLAYPYRIEGDTDLVVVSAECADALIAALPHREKAVKAALRLTDASLAALARIRSGSRAAVLCRDPFFGECVLRAGRSLAPGAVFEAPFLMSGEYEDCLSCDTVIVPASYGRLCPGELEKKLDALDQQGRLVCCELALDQGSLLNIGEKISEIKSRK